MNIQNSDCEKRIESKLEVSTYVSRLKFALENGGAQLVFQEERLVDEGRDEKYTNRYTIAELFPKQDPVEALKDELKLIKVEEYIETVKDLRFQKRSEMRVFGRYYSANEVYIKIRVELMQASAAGVNNAVFVMSFHNSTIPFKNVIFPYK